MSDVIRNFEGGAGLLNLNNFTVPVCVTALMRCVVEYMYTSGHKSVDAERAICLISTHWNTVWSNRHHRAFPCFPLQRGVTASIECVLQCSMLCQFQFHFKFHVSRSGVRIPVKAIFCDVTPMTTHANQSVKLFKKYPPLIDQCGKLGEGKKAKKWTWLEFEPPRPGNLEFDVELELPQSNHAVEEKRESSLWCLLFHTVFQWVFIGQLAVFRVNRFVARGVWGKSHELFTHSLITIHRILG